MLPNSDIYISYCIEAKIIGEISDYQEYLYTENNHPKKTFTKLVNIDEAFVNLYVMPRESFEEQFNEQFRGIYSNLLKRARKKNYTNQKRMSNENSFSVSNITYKR